MNISKPQGKIEDSTRLDRSSWMCRRLLWVVWPDENSVAGCKTRRVRYIAPSYGGSIRGTHGVAHYVPARSPLNVRPSGPAVHAQMQPAWAAHSHGATLSDATRVLRTRRKSSPQAQPRHANRIASLESPSFSATEPLSRPKAAAQMRGTSRSMLPGSGHDICPGERPRGGTRWPTAHRMSEHRTTHARALLTAC